MSPEKKHPSIIPETPGNLIIREALVETLAKAKGAYIQLYLTGGTAAAVYAGETRPLSPDLDFLVEPDAKEKIQHVFGGEFRRFDEKKLFKSHKMVAKSGNDVQLDFIAEQNIVPDESRPQEKISLHLSAFTKKKSCEKDFMNERVMVLPPEFVVIAKLFAGRGPELGKYDLADSGAVIESGIIRPDIFKKAFTEITGKNEPIRKLAVERLLKSLGGLAQTAKVMELAEALRSIEITAGTPRIKRISSATHARIQAAGEIKK
jgi:hypothetical protein